MSRPLISVLMLSYNHQDFIEKSIESVVKQKNDDIDIEIILIDDGSTDATVKILENIKRKIEIPFKLIKKKHQGVKAIAKNFNELIALSNGDYLAFLSCDDEFIDNRFLEQISILKKNNKVKLVYGNGYNIKKNNIIGLTNSEESNVALLSGDCDKVYNHCLSKVPVLFLQSILMDASFAKSFSPFDESLIADDWVFNIRTFKELSNKNLEYEFINKPVFKRNIHSTNSSNNSKVQVKRVFQVVDKYFSSDNAVIFKKKYAKKQFKKGVTRLKYSYFKKSLLSFLNIYN